MQRYTKDDLAVCVNTDSVPLTLGVQYKVRKVVEQDNITWLTVVDDEGVLDSFCSSRFQKYEAERGLKYDGGKNMVGLLMTGCAKALLGVAKVLTYGAKKYEAHSWRDLPDAIERYNDALYRHLLAYAQGEWIDAVEDGGSGEPHLAHALCCLLFIFELELEKTANGVINAI